jgi:hypothetical protein
MSAIREFFAAVIVSLSLVLGAAFAPKGYWPPRPHLVRSGGGESFTGPAYLERMVELKKIKVEELIKRMTGPQGIWIKIT